MRAPTSKRHRRPGRRTHGRVARQIFAYVLRDLTAPDGGFYAAEDADSDGEEGRFYTWSRADIVGVLGRDGRPGGRLLRRDRHGRCCPAVAAR